MLAIVVSVFVAAAAFVILVLDNLLVSMIHWKQKRRENKEAVEPDNAA
jgi:hypothetical protein